MAPILLCSINEEHWLAHTLWPCTLTCIVKLSNRRVQNPIPRLVFIPGTGAGCLSRVFFEISEHLHNVIHVWSHINRWLMERSGSMIRVSENPGSKHTFLRRTLGKSVNYTLR